MDMYTLLYLKWINKDLAQETLLTFNPELKLPKYVYDKHTACAPESQRSYTFFIDNIILKPRMPKTELELKGEELYKTTNKACSNYISKLKYTAGDIYTINLDNYDLIQTQLITGRYKPRTWFCKLKSSATWNKSYVLKGPVKDDYIEQILLTEKIKKLLGLTSVNAKVVAYHDQYYLIMKNLIPINPSEQIIKSSKLETNVSIYNGPTYVLSSKEFSTYEPSIQLEVIKCLWFRKLIGTNDTCDRNIIVHNNTVASIDDPAILEPTDYMFKKPITNTTIKKAYENTITNHEAELTAFIDSVYTKVEESDLDEHVKEFIITQADNIWDNEF